MVGGVTPGKGGETALGLPVFDTPQEFAESLKKESDAWAEFIRRTGIVLEQ